MKITFLGQPTRDSLDQFEKRTGAIKTSNRLAHSIRLSLISTVAARNRNESDWVPVSVYSKRSCKSSMVNHYVKDICWVSNAMLQHARYKHDLESAVIVQYEQYYSQAILVARQS